MLSLGKLKARTKELNATSCPEVSNTPEGSCGAQQSLQTALREQVVQLLKDAPPSAAFRSTKRIRVKLTADGTNMGKRHHCIVVAFTLLDASKTVASADGVHPIAVIDVEENYEQLKLALSDIVAEVENLEILTVDDENFQVHYM